MMAVPNSTTYFRPAAAAKQCAASCIDMGFVALCAVIAAIVGNMATVTFMVALEAVIALAVGEGSRGVTPGNLMLGLRTIRVEGARDAAAGVLPAGMRRIVVKYCLFIASVLGAIVGLVLTICSPLFDHGDLNQGWANKLASLASVDIRQPAVPAALSAQVREPKTATISTSSKPMRHKAHQSSVRPRPTKSLAPQPRAAAPVPMPPAHAQVPTPKVSPIPPARRPNVPASSSAIPAAPTPRAQSAAKAALLFDDGSQKTFAIPSTLVLGRKPVPHKLQDMVLTIPDHTGTVSRSHARLEITEDGAWVTDLGSTNGTRIIGANGTTTELSAGQRLSMHATSRMFLGDVGCAIIMPTHRRTRS